MKIFKKDVVMYSIIMSIITYCICKLLVEPVLDVAKSFQGNIFTFFIDLYYRMAATASAYFFLILSFSSLLVIFYSYFMGAFSKNPKRIDNERDEERYEKMDSEQLSAEKEKLEIESEKIKKEIKFMSKIGMIISTVYLVTVLVYFVLPNTLKATFEMSIVRLTPYTDSRTVDVLKSDWIRMKSQKDYYKIKQKMDIIVKDNKLD